MSDYPEHEKLKALNGDNDTVGAFIEWLSSEGYVISKWGYPIEYQAYIDLAKVPPEPTKLIRRWFLNCEADAHWSEILEAAQEYGAVIWHPDSGISPGEQDVLGYTHWALPDPEELDTRWIETRLNEKLLWPALESIEDLIARHFDIDARKLSDEKQAIYETLREPLLSVAKDI